MPVGRPGSACPQHHVRSRVRHGAPGFFVLKSPQVVFYRGVSLRKVQLSSPRPPTPRQRRALAGGAALTRRRRPTCRCCSSPSPRSPARA